MHSIDLFLNYEQENKLLLKDIDGFYFWGYIRFYLYSFILNSKEGLQKESKVYCNTKTLVGLFRSLTINNPFLAKGNVDYFISQHPRKIKKDNYYECIYTDDIINKLNSPCLVIERPYERIHYTPAKNKNVKYTDFITAKSMVKSKFIIKKHATRIIEKEVQTIVNDINRIYNVEIKVEEVVRHTINAYKRWLVQKPLLKRLIKKHTPKCILEVVYYSFMNLVINEVAKEEKIPTIELQHGTMGYYHIAYNFSERCELPYLPDKIFLYSDYWKGNTRLPQKEEDLIVTGYPYMEKKIAEKKLKNNINDREKNKITILVISQLTIGNVLSKFVVDLVREMKEAGIKYKIIYKLHGSEYSSWKSRYPWLEQIKGEIEIIDNNEKSIYEYFAISDVQVGIYSTALFEGLAYKLKTFLLEAYGIEYMQDVLNKRYAKLVRKPSDLIDALVNEEDGKPLDIEFWEENAMNNVLTNLRMITGAKR